MVPPKFSVLALSALCVTRASADEPHRSGVGAFGQPAPSQSLVSEASAPDDTSSGEVSVDESSTGAAGALRPRPDAQRAQVSPSADVTVVLVGFAGDDPMLEAAVRDLLSAEGVEALFLRRSRLSEAELLEPRRLTGDGRVSIWIAVNPQRARLFLADAGQQRYLIRDVGLARGLDALGREQIAQIVGASAEALLRSNVGIGRDAMREAIQADLAEQRVPVAAETNSAREHDTPPRPAPRGRWRPLLGAVYASRWTGPALGVQHGPGLRLGLRQTERPWGASLEFVHTWAQHYDIYPVTVGLRTTSARLLLETNLLSNNSASLEAALGLGLDLTSVDPGTIDASGFAAEGTSNSLTPWLRLELGPHLRVQSWQVFVAGLVDVSPGDTHYDVAEADARRVVLRPWQIRPGILVGFSWGGAG